MAKNDNEPQTVGNPNPNPNSNFNTNPNPNSRRPRNSTPTGGSTVPGLDIEDKSVPTRQATQQRNANLISQYRTDEAAKEAAKKATANNPAPNIPGVSNPASEDNDPFEQTSKQYGGMDGWDVHKLNNNLKHNTKYDFGRAIADYGHLDRGNLQSLVDYYNSTYGGKNGNISVTGEDSISTPEGWNIDLINGDTEGPQWLVL